MSNNSRIIPFLPQKTSRVDKESGIDEKGKIGDLDIVVYDRGIIHIFNEKKYPGLKFKKDPELFEEEIEDIDFNKLNEDDSLTIEGCGDNDHLVLTIKDGEVIPSLKKREHGVIKKIKEFINKGKQRKKGKKAKTEAI